MNRRIRQIAIATDAWCDQQFPDSECPMTVWEDKFAELIVREAVGMVGCHSHVSGYELGRVLLDHFGVEE
jgi:hypothetical protein